MSVETFYCAPTETVPNSHLPVLVYRNVLHQPCSEEDKIIEQIEENEWEHRVRGRQYRSGY